MNEKLPPEIEQKLKDMTPKEKEAYLAKRKQALERRPVAPTEYVETSGGGVMKKEELTPEELEAIKERKGELSTD